MSRIKYDNYTFDVERELSFDPKQNSEMVKHITQNPYGDWVALSVALRLVLDEFPNDDYKILELGIAHGHFLKNMFDYMEHVKFGKTNAYGVDSKLHDYCPCQLQGPRMHFVEGKTTEVYTKFSDEEFHFIFVDACHCHGHVFKDFTNYNKKVKVGGYIAFHDTNPDFQGGSQQPRTDECSKDTHIGVVKGIKEFDPESNGFELLLKERSNGEYWGGVTIYKRVK